MRRYAPIAKEQINRTPPADWFQDWDQIKTKNLRVFLVCRESGRNQEWRGNLDEIEANLRREIRGAECRVAGAYKFVCSGWAAEMKEHWETARRRAEKAEADLVINESTARWIRSRWYDCQRFWGAQPVQEELVAMRDCLHPYVPTVLVSAASTAEQIRAYEIRRGKEWKRLRKEQNKRENNNAAIRDKIYWMRGCKMDPEAIADALGLSRSAYYRHCKVIDGKEVAAY